MTPAGTRITIEHSENPVAAAGGGNYDRSMNVGIIGSGSIGSTVAQLCVDVGHGVVIANRRGPASLDDLVAHLGERARAVTVEEAAAFGELVLVAVPFGALDDLPAAAFYGRVVVDAANYYPARDGAVARLDDDDTTSSELLAAHLPGATVVKAFNTMYYATLASAGDRTLTEDERLALFLAGDDTEAKALVGTLIRDVGFAPVDTGTLAVGGRLQQPGSPIYATDINGAAARQYAVG